MICAALVNIGLFANMGPQGFSDYPNAYFVETGTFGGDSVQKALDTGYAEVRSIEFASDNYDYCSTRFLENSKVKLFLGDSSKDLWTVIHDIDKPVTFWLDAHVYPPRTDGGKNCPLIEELDQIKRHPIKTHTILIDDMHCAGTASFDGLTIEDLKTKILEINPDYEISFIPGGDQGEYPQNVLVAKVK
ncbi:MAG: hypothetical protein SP1CHLAM54_04190 [Chlamydiia bacterium]|nr:hypothetical protein [Chlamydiia bacterium]MCH9615334.1 hypothetical protein [Chlamydiia bacterium]MCH9628344.1 hypothetical protein [Chlamydiia bacterium]